MGCFLGCFGASKDANRRKITENSSPRNPNLGNQYQPIDPDFAAKLTVLETPSTNTLAEKQEILEKPILPKSRVNTKEQLSLGSHKRVTFDPNIQEYEHTSAAKVPEITQESEKETQKGIEENCKIQSKSPTESDGGSTLSSSSSFPPNHRYQNYRESDDECENLDCQLDNDENEFDNDEVDNGEYYYEDSYSTDFEDLPAGSCSSMESRTDKSPTKSESPDKENKTQRFSCGSPLLNPVENTTHWKAMKAKENLPLKPHKEKFTIVDSKRLTSKWDEPNSSNHEIAVNASLSTWLISSEKTPPKKTTSVGLEPIASAASASSYGSNSVKSHEGRPILGALTMEEVSPIGFEPRSPPRSPVEKPLAGRVGVHWNDETPIGDTSSVSSFKGIPNTSSKYREDKRVMWHSTPFETRLERALNKDTAQAK